MLVSRLPAHDVGRDAVTVALDGGMLERLQRRDVVLDALLVATGREVGHLVSWPVDALERRRDGIEGRVALDVTI